MPAWMLPQSNIIFSIHGLPQAGLDLVLSPSGASAAVVEQGGRRVALLSADTRFRPPPVAVFEPLPISTDGVASPDIITCCNWSCPNQDSSSDGDGSDERLVVVCRSSCVYIIDRRGQLALTNLIDGHMFVIACRCDLLVTGGGESCDVSRGKPHGPAT